MRVPVSLLKQMVPVEVDLDTLARTLNARVSEIEHTYVFPSREAFGDVRLVKLLEAVAAQGEHTRWRTSAGFVVVGDRFGVRAGEVYAAVMAGGKLPDGVAIEARAVAGMPSEGVLVSEVQLGIGKDAARPLRLAPEVQAGADAWETLELDDVVLEFDLEPNRPDLFSLAGMARDVAAIWGLPLTLPDSLPLDGAPALATPKIELQTSRARAYLAVGLTGVSVHPSPQWLQNAVRKLGMRPINNVVDAANLAMFELGQPLHTFDRAALRTDTIALRMAAPGERITTLDAVERTLTDECLLVCDGDVPVALAGVMGDATSEVHEGTTDVLIECAAFDMAAVRRASRRLALRTEASVRFEKGLPVSTVRPAAERLARLLVDVAGARLVGTAWAGSPPPAPAEIRLDRDWIRSRLGMDPTDADIDRLLTASGAVVRGGSVAPPESRPDLRIPEDLVEEVGRLHGYEHVKSVAPTVSLVAPKANRYIQAATRARRVLTALGWDEVVLPVWLGEREVARFQLDRNKLIALKNPVSEDYAFFRTTPIPALVEAAVQNRKEVDRFAVFEVGKAYFRTEEGGISERWHLSGIAMGEPLLAVRDALVELSRALGAGGDLVPAEAPCFAHPFFHPGRAFGVGGWIEAGELHPALVRAAELREAPVAFTADLERVAGLPRVVSRYVPAPRFPSISLDINVVVGPRTQAAAVLAAVPGVEDLRRAEVVDVWPLAEGARITLRLELNALERSLTQEEAVERFGRVKEALAERGWGLPG